MTTDDLSWAPEASGIGSLLMTDPALPRDDFGHPYQALFWFDAEGRTLGLVVDEEDHVLGYQNNAEGDPLLLSDPPRCQRLPGAIEDAARQWWADERNSRP